MMSAGSISEGWEKSRLDKCMIAEKKPRLDKGISIRNLLLPVLDETQYLEADDVKEGEASERDIVA